MLQFSMADKENQFQDVVGSLLNGMDTLLSAKTVVGETTTVGDTIIIPLVDISFGVGVGAGDNNKKGSSSGAGGLGGKITPSAVLIVKDGYTKVINVKNQDTLTKVVDMVPDLIDKITNRKNHSVDIDDEDAVDIAFPDED